MAELALRDEMPDGQQGDAALQLDGFTEHLFTEHLLASGCHFQNLSQFLQDYLSCW